MKRSILSLTIFSLCLLGAVAAHSSSAPPEAPAVTPLDLSGAASSNSCPDGAGEATAVADPALAAVGEREPAALASFGLSRKCPGNVPSCFVPQDCTNGCEELPDGCVNGCCVC